MTSDFDEAYYLSKNPDVVLAVKRGLVQNGWEHYVRFGKDEGRLPAPPPGTASPRKASTHREATLEHLRGEGVEIGALNRPVGLAEGARARYVDRFTPEEASKIVEGLSVDDLVAVDTVVDVDRQGLAPFERESLDFCVACNVVQHLANPIRFFEEIFRVTRPGGHVVLSVPDKRFTFESVRPTTEFDHVMDEYFHGVDSVSDARFVDLLVLFCPEDVQRGVSAIGPRIEGFRRKLEHAHVWDSGAFEELWTRGLRVVDVEAELVVEARGDVTGIEYFVVLRKIRQMFE
jgi:SAM-dependent methyltransferase